MTCGSHGAAGLRQMPLASLWHVDDLVIRLVRQGNQEMVMALSFC